MTALFDIIGMQRGNRNGPSGPMAVLVRVLLGRRESLWEAHCVAREYSDRSKITTYVIGPKCQITIYTNGHFVRGESPLRLIPPCAESRQRVLGLREVAT